MSNPIKKILVSEKSFQSATAGKYTFVVDRQTDKETVAKICKEMFNVTVTGCNSMNYIGKIKQSRKNRGKRSDFKKMILTLKAGDKIDLFEIESEETKANKKAKKEEKIVDNTDTKVTIRSKKDKKVKEEKVETKETKEEK